MGIPLAAEVIIVGGGVTGLNTALQLKQLGVERVLLLERHHVGAGQSGRAAGIVRALVGHPAVAAALVEAINFFTDFNEQYGENAQVNRLGYLLLNEADQAGHLAQIIRQAGEVGCQAQLISAGEAAELQPGLRQDAETLYAFEPSAIQVDPMAMTQALARAARRLGVEIWEGVEVQALLTAAGSIQGVRTAQGDIAAGKVVLGTAAWGTPQLAALGVAAPVYPHRVEMGFFTAPPHSPLRLQRVLSDVRSRLYLRPEGAEQMFVGWREGDFIAGVADLEPADPDNYWQTARYPGLTKMQRCLTVTLPFMVEGFVQRTYACVYDYSPDGMPILDQAEPVKGLYFALGHSGGGFSLSPWVGRTMAHFVAHGAKPPELNLLRLSRFAENDPVTWSNVKKKEPA